MDRLWLWLLPLIFLPNMGLARLTDYGTLDRSDYVMVPYLLFVWLGSRKKPRLLVDEITKPVLLLIFWCILGITLIRFRFDYEDYYYTSFSALKLVKFLAYGLAGFLTVKAASTDRTRLRTAIVAATLVVGVGLAFYGDKTKQKSGGDLGRGTTVLAESAATGYKSPNQVSAAASVFFCYLAGGLFSRRLVTGWARALTVGAMIASTVGLAVGQSRGAWLAAIVGLLYIAVKGGIRWQTALVIFGLSLLTWVLYTRVPVFQDRVLDTFFPETRNQAALTTAGIDNGGRPYEWISGVRQFDYPILGTGFFHRGGDSGLWTTGSHNFFLQMFLETGVPGGLMTLIIFARLWKHAGSVGAKALHAELPVKAGLIAAFVAGMSGEYYYGGTSLFGLFLVYAACGSIRVKQAFGDLNSMQPVPLPVVVKSRAATA